jgi:hypothetical protein
MIGESAPPRWLSFDYLLAQFSVQRKAAIRKYRLFVQESLKHGPIWTRLNNQIYLGGKEFIDKEQRHVQIQRDDLQSNRSFQDVLPEPLITQYRCFSTTQEINDARNNQPHATPKPRRLGTTDDTLRSQWPQTTCVL